MHLVTTEELDRAYPVPDGHDPHADELGHVPYTPELFAALGTLVARRIAALCRPPRKVVVLDCDETLWKGVCAEDGPFGVTLDTEHRALQEFMRAQREAGMLLALCSKNEPEDVLDVFRSNPELPLRSDDFAGRRINWQPKSENLASLAQELGLGLDGFVFVDDNAAECAEVEASCPEVLALALPQQGVAAFLSHVWAFDRPGTTQEDRARAAMYAQNLERARLEKRVRGLEGFLEALRLEVGIAPVAADELARVAQLTQRTNQMNATTVRRSEIDLRDLLRSGAECLSVHVSDRFGSYGLVGVVLFHATADALAVDTFLLSCRALGKGVEHRMMARLGELACERGKTWLEMRFVRTARNWPALDFLKTVAGEPELRPDGSQLFRIAATAAAETRPRSAPGSRAVDARLEEAGSVPAVRPAPSRGTFDDAHVARALRDPRAILEAVTARQEVGPSRAPVSGPPRTELERELVALWGEMLGAPRVGVHDSFFDLGGHSLLAVQLLSRVRQLYAVELSLELVYSGSFTVAELAKAIEVAQIEQAGAAEYAAALADVESLSDEEARALLESEKNRPPGPGGGRCGSCSRRTRPSCRRAAERRAATSPGSSGWLPAGTSAASWRPPSRTTRAVSPPSCATSRRTCGRSGLEPRGRASARRPCARVRSSSTLPWPPPVAASCCGSSSVTSRRTPSSSRPRTWGSRCCQRRYARRRAASCTSRTPRSFSRSARRAGSRTRRGAS